MTRKDTISLEIFLLGCVAIVLTLIYVSQNFEVNSVLIRGLPVKNYNDGWERFDKGFEEKMIKLPRSDKPDNFGNITIKKRLPDKLDSEQSICIETEHQSLRVWIDGKIIYEQGTDVKTPLGNTFGSIWNLVPITVDDAGKEIIVQFKSSLSRSTMRLYGMRIARESAILYTLVVENIPLVFVTFIVFTQGFISTILGIFSWKRNYKNMYKMHLYLGAFSIMAAIWMITDSKILQFEITNYAFIYLASFLTFELMSAPFMMYMGEICPHYSKVFRNYSLAFSCLFLFNFSMYLFGWIDLVYTITLVHILIFSVIPLMMISCYKEAKVYENPSAREVFWGLCILGSASAISIPMFYAKKASNNTIFFKYGILLFILFLGIEALKKEIAIVRESTKVQAYKRLAYLDTMTMISNRAAFDQELDKLRQEYQKYTTISIMVFDINNLKYVNDTYGHSVGDDLIKGFAQCLDIIFKQPCEAYRIGGDEFAVIAKSWSEWDIEHSSERLKEYVDSYNENCKNKIAYAWGYGHQVIRRTGDLNLYALLNVADKKMYNMKRKMRSRARG